MNRFLIVAIVVALTAPALRGQSGNDLFQKGLSKERAEGQIDEAIQIYERIVKEFAADRPLAAKALLQIGRAYERLGRAEAQKAYERLLREYADQRAVAAEARARLAALGQASSKPTRLTTRPVWGGPGYVDTFGSASPDGRYLSFTDWETGDLAVRDLESGATRRLTAKGSWIGSPEFAEFSVFSPDGNQIAHAWSYRNAFYELRLVGPRGGQSRTVYRNEEVRYVQPFDWSPDGKQIITLFVRSDRTNQLVLVSAADGSVRVLKTFDWRGPWKAVFSPDGRYVVYDFPPVEDALERDLFLLAVDGSREVPLVQHPAHDFLLGWFPRGDRVLFASNRTGTNGAWTIRVENGRPQGNAELLKPGIGHVRAMNFTKAGGYFYAPSTGLRDVYTATLDPSTGQLVDELTSFKGRFEEGKLAAVWSPDGALIAYLVQSSLVRGGEGANTLAIQTLETGQVRNIPLKMSYANRLQWLPDSRALIVGGTELKGREGLFRVDLLGGTFEPVMYGQPGRFVMTPDARTLFYEGQGIVARDLRTGEEKDIYAFWRFSGLALSPDGRWLAVQANLRAGDGSVSPFPSIQILPASGGEPQTILTLADPDSSQWRQMAWSADGKYVFFTEHDQQLWQIPAAGGTPKRLAADLPFINSISVHPDGRRLAVSAGSANYEVWVMENLLAATKTNAARR